MIRYCRHVLTIALLLIGTLAFAQNNAPLDKTIESLQKQAAENPFEKVYLQMDKPYYGAGDTIWFKGYTVIGADHRLSGRSNVLNIELIDERNNIQRSIKLPILGGISYGDIALPDTLQAGNYRLRAYTNWMRNAGAEYFFNKEITIVNAISNKVFAKASYTYTLVNNKQTVNTIINFTDLTGKPYANKDVSYAIELDPQLIAKSKGVTDASGNLNITFANPNAGTLEAGRISTTMKLDNQTTAKNIIAIKETTSKVDVQFFPESGNLVNGIRSKVAFKAVGADGLGAEIKGTITDDQGNELAAFNSTHLGMGSFMLGPEAGKAYKANIAFADSTKATINLPKALDKGYVMAINNRDTANVVVKIFGVGYENQTGGLSLVVQSGGVVYLQAKGSPGKTSFTANIAKNKLPSGIMQFTLFSDAGEPLNERLVFIQNPDQLKLGISATKSTYTPREKVKINLDVKDGGNRPVQGNFSIAVVDESKVPVDVQTESTILSNLLLTSDIKGYIEQPNYYFAKVNDKTQADLDVLMLTQGYHRYEWKQVMINAQPNIVYQPEKAISIAGTVKDAYGKPVPKTKVSLINNNGDMFVIDTLSDNNGRFSFSLDFSDSTKFTLKAMGDNLTAELDNTPPVIGYNKNAADMQVSINKGLDTYLQNSRAEYEQEVKNHVGNHSVALKEVTINNTRTKTPRELAIAKAVEFSANLNGKGQANQIVTSEVFEGMGCARIADCLAGRLAGITFDRNGNPHAARGGNSFSLGTGMLVMVDGIPSTLNSLNPEDVSSIEVLKSGGYTAIYGTKGAGGVLIVTTKHGSGFVDDAKTGTGAVMPQGYYKAKEFYSPKYDKPTSSTIADLRTTVYWKPIIQTDKDGHTFVEYYNADGKGTYRVTVEGIDYGGNIGHQVYKYTVQ